MASYSDMQLQDAIAAVERGQSKQQQRFGIPSNNGPENHRRWKTITNTWLEEVVGENSAIFEGLTG